MKYAFCLLVFIWISELGAQTVSPSFLYGTWKMEGKEIYERWDSLNAHSFRGLSYKVSEGGIDVIEYLDISIEGSEMFYTATVPGQNQGSGVVFTLADTNLGYTFRNPEHDFPNQIKYLPLNDTIVFVEVSDDAGDGFSYNLIRQKSNHIKTDSTVSNPNYDARLSEQLGADDYGMKSYLLVVLKTGPNTTSDAAFIGECFRGHLDNISRLAEEGNLVLAGPLGKNANAYRGIFILDVSTKEEAEQLLQTDPAIREGLLQADIYQWYGSAALPEYLKVADKIWKVKP